MSQLSRFIISSGPGSGTVTSISEGTGITLTPNPITTTGTVALTVPVVIANGGTNATSFTNTDGIVYFDGTRLVDTTVGTAGEVLTSNGVGMAPTFQASSATGAVTTLTGNIGGAVSPLLGNINTIVTTGQGTAQVVGDPGSNTTGILFSVTATSNTAIGLNSLLSPVSGSINNTAFGVQALEGNTTGHNNSGFGYQTLVGLTSGNNNLALGYLAGSNYTGAEANNVLLANAGVVGESNVIRIGASQTTAYMAGIYGVSPSTPQMVVVNSAGQLGSQAIGSGSIDIIDGDTGSVTGTTVTIYANNATQNCGSSVLFSNSGTISTLNVTDSNSNTIMGKGAGNNSLSGNLNTGAGNGVLASLTSGSGNSAFGYNTLTALTGAGNNDAVGNGSMQSLVSGANNVGFGNGTLNQLVSGFGNVALGNTAGFNYTGSESYNIVIGAGVDGTVNESHVLRIGSGTGTGVGNLQEAFICGINGITVGAADQVLVIDATDQIGAIAAGTSGYVLTSNGAAALPSWQAAASGNITIAGDSGGGLTGISFTFTGGSTGLTFAGAGTTETLGGTLAIANGGTNATSMSTSTGIVKYDGTRLVTSSTAKIDSSNRMTNTAQPAFMAYLVTTTTNNTGDNTLYTVTFDTVAFDQGSNFSSSTTFTAPITGRYLFGANVCYTGASAANSLGIVSLNTTAYKYDFQIQTVGAIVFVNEFTLGGTIVVPMTSGDTATITTQIAGSTKTVGIQGDSGTRPTYFYGYLVA